MTHSDDKVQEIVKTSQQQTRTICFFFENKQHTKISDVTEFELNKLVRQICDGNRFVLIKNNLIGTSTIVDLDLDYKPNRGGG